MYGARSWFYVFLDEWRNLGLLGICFWREGLEAALGPERRGGERGLILERAAPRCGNQIIPEKLLRIRDTHLGDHRLYVYAAMSINPGFNFQLTRGLRGPNESKFLEKIKHKDSFRFSAQLNNLLLSVVHCPEARGGFESSLTIMGRVLAPIISGVSLGNFQPAIHIFPNFEMFCRSIYVIPDDPGESSQS
jgi:hypothetical protein